MSVKPRRSQAPLAGWAGDVADGEVEQLAGPDAGDQQGDNDREVPLRPGVSGLAGTVGQGGQQPFRGVVAAERLGGAFRGARPG